MTGNRALLAAPRHPARDQGAGARCVLDLAAALTAEGYSIVFCALDAEPGWQRYRRDLEQLGIEVRGGAGSVRSDIEAGRFDVAALAFWRTGEELGPLLRERSPRTAVIIHSVDLHFLRLARHAAVSGSGRDAGHDLGDEFRRELGAYHLADQLLTVSDKEAQLVGDLLSDRTRCRTIPLSERDLGPVIDLSGRRGVVFVGNFRHVPNVEAIETLCAEILPGIDPRVLDRNPLTVVGNGLFSPSLGDVRAGMSRFPGVRLVGRVPDVGPYVRRARVSVAPLLHGAGVKGKILESLSAGTPMVTTAVGVEGMADEVAAAVAVAGDPYAAACAVESLLVDDEQWRYRSAAGRRAVLEHHGAGFVVDRLRAAIAASLVAASERQAGSGAEGSARRHWEDSYRSVRERFPRVVAAAVPEGGRVLVVSGGDECLVSVPLREAFHFPRGADGVHAGFHPADGASAVSHLRDLITDGRWFLAVPASAGYWLHRYPEFHAYLCEHARLVARDACGRVYELAAPGVRLGPPDRTADVTPPVQATHRRYVGGANASTPGAAAWRS